MKLVLVVLACMLPALGAGTAQQTPPASAQKTATSLPKAAATPAPKAVAGPLPGANLVNPQKPTKAALAEAKLHYSWDCAMCHGDTGKGDGSLAVSEKMKMMDFTNPATLKGLADGQIFMIIRKGSATMPPEEKARADDATVWNLVNYLRSMSQAPAN